MINKTLPLLLSLIAFTTIGYSQAAVTGQAPVPNVAQGAQQEANNVNNAMIQKQENSAIKQAENTQNQQNHITQPTTPTPP